MLDVVRVVALLAALAGALRVRSLAAVLACAAVGCLDAIEIASGLVTRGSATLPAWYGFVFVLLGPSGLPASGAPWPYGALARHSVAVHLAVASFLVAPLRALAHRSAVLRPETPEARALDRAELRLTLILILEVMLAVVLLGADYFSRSGG